MGNINAVPIVSQTKSLVQVIAGDEEGALTTQVKFSRECPIVSQVNSAVHAALGDVVEAKRIQEEDFVGSMLDLVNALPVVGHIKAVIHYATNEPNEGDKAMKAASRTTGTVVGGLIGSVGGPAGAVAGGIVGGTLTDGLTTAIDSAVHDEFRPSGMLKQATAIANDEAQSTSGAAFDLVAQIVFDGLSGYSAANNVGVVDAPAVVNKPPGIVDEATKHEGATKHEEAGAAKSYEFKVWVYKHRAYKGVPLEEQDEFERATADKFTHESAGKYIRDAVKEAIQKTFSDAVEKAKKNLDEANKTDDKAQVEKAQEGVDKLLKNNSRYEVHILKEKDSGKGLCVPFAHLGWGDSAKTDVYAKLDGVCIVIDVEPNIKEGETGSHTARIITTYPLDENNKPLKWKQVEKDSANISGDFFDIHGSKTVKVSQAL